MYGYDEAMIEQLRDFILEGEIQPETIKNNNQVIVTANMDGQGNYFFMERSRAIPLLFEYQRQKTIQMNC